MNTIACRTNFDITATGVLGQYRENHPVVDMSTGAVLQDRAAWIKARNQQRNWETMQQIISLRCLPENISAPRRDGDCWCFDFAVPSLAAVSDQDQDLKFLHADAHGVPMISGLDETVSLTAALQLQGTEANCWFTVIDHK